MTSSAVTLFTEAKYASLLSPSAFMTTGAGLTSLRPWTIPSCFNDHYPSGRYHTLWKGTSGVSSFNVTRPYRLHRLAAIYITITLGTKL